MAQSNHYKKWTSLEEEIVIESVKRQPTNLSYAFLVASETLGRTPESITYRWYTKLKNSPQVYTLSSEYWNSINTKNHKMADKTVPTGMIEMVMSGIRVLATRLRALVST